MQMREVKIEIPSDIFIALNEDDIELGKQLRLILAIQYYRKKKLTIGKAAQLAGVTKYEFETVLSEHQIPISLLTKADVISDVGQLNEITILFGNARR